MDSELLPKQTTNLKNSVISRLEREALCPRSRTYFNVKEGCVWLLWLISVLVGALAVAVTLFVVSSRQFSLYEATHENFITFLFLVAPYLWLAILTVMVTAAWYQLRNTKRGYRFSVPWLLVGSVVFSTGLGGALHSIGTGFSIDQTLGKIVSDYPSQEKLELTMWQQPAAGRLVGQLAVAEVSAASAFYFNDAKGKQWQLNVSELQEADLVFLNSRTLVKLVGLPRESGADTFYACGVFPWTYHQDHSRAELVAIQRQDRERMRRHKLAILEADLGSEAVENPTQHCSDMVMARRLE